MSTITTKNIAKPTIKLKPVPYKNPIKAPFVELKAFFLSEESCNSSPMKTPANIPIKNPKGIGIKNIPTKVPTTEPMLPHFVPPYFLLVFAGIT